MKYPCLIPKRQCKTQIKLTLYEEGLSETGSPIIFATLDTTCNYQDSAKTVLSADKKLIQLSGVALFTNDICPELPTLSGGTAIIYGVERTIFRGTKARNPDGTVNYTKLEFE